jgi:glutamyl-tRNA reductase
MMNKFLHAPMTGMRKSANEGDIITLAALKKLFNSDRS